MRAIYLVPALLLSTLAFSSASATPAAPVPGNAVHSPMTRVQYDNHERRKARRAVRRHERYRAGHHYRSAPHGWHRFERRPDDWSTRGCILVGPFWFCP
jgi:hypothetical protein